MFARLGRFSFRHRRAVVFGWLGVLVLGIALMAGLGTNYRSAFTLPNVESKAGFDLLSEHFPQSNSGGMSGSIVFRAEQGVKDPAVQQAMTTMFDQAGQIPGVVVVSPYDARGAAQIAAQGPEAGKVAFATVNLPQGTSQSDAQTITDKIRALEPSVPGLDVYLGGRVFSSFEAPSSEALGLGFAVIVLILAFGSVLAMGLPIGTAIGGIAVGSAVIGLLSNVITMPDFTSTLAVMIGLGVGIDYALFIVTRYREHLHRGDSVEDSVTIAIDTAGRAVVFAGTTVVISLLGMIVMGVEFVRGLAIGAAVVVAVTMLASITLLPALISMAGHRVEVTRWRGLIAAGLVAIALVGVGLKVQPLLVGMPLAVIVVLASFAVSPLRREVPRRAPKPMRETLPYKWSRLVQHHSWASLLIGAALLVVLALPFLSLRLGFSDEGNYPSGTDTKTAYDLIARSFGPGVNGPLLLVAEIPPGTGTATVQQVTKAVAAAPGVAAAIGPNFDNPSAPTAVVWQVIPTTAPQDAGTTELVHHLRGDVLPAATQGTGVKVLVAGTVATNIDFSDYLSARLPWFFGVVLTLSFLLLMVVFRSLLVPLKAVIMNLLSIAAAYGVVVLVFQWGWGGTLIGISGGPIEPFVPMMMFAIVFGLSMDYEVFLLSRIKEEYDRTGDAKESVADGLAATARVITAAAAIMVVVFGSFLLDSNRIIKLFGVGLATAVLLDATIVRMLLVPATMELLGEKNWWLPRWLDRLLPRIDVEGHRDDSPHPDAGELGEGDEDREPALR